jgi:hypothetical protein
VRTPCSGQDGVREAQHLGRQENRSSGLPACPVIPRISAAAPHLITLSEARRCRGRTVTEIRLVVSRERLSADLPPVLNLGQTAWAICVSRWTARALIERGELPGNQTVSGAYLVWQIPVEAVKRWAEKREAEYAKRCRSWSWYGAVRP